MAGEFYISNLIGDFDYQPYLDKMKEVKMIPVQNLKAQEGVLSAKLKGINAIKSKLSSLLSAVDSLTSDDLYDVRKVSVSDSSVLSAEIVGDVQEATYDVSVSQLAKSNSYVVGTVNKIASLDSPLSSNGSLVISYKENGEAESFSVDYGGKTLKEVAQEINDSGKIKATIINRGTADSPDYQLLLSPVKTGTENEITGIDDTANPGDDSAGIFSEDSSKTYESESAQDAKVLINGVEFVSAENTVTPIEGLKLTLKSTGSAEVTVGKSDSKITSAIDKVLKNYNALKDTIDALTSKGHPLEGEFSVKSVERAIFNEIMDKLGKFGVVDTDGTPETTKGHLILKEDALKKVYDSQEFQDALKSLGNALEAYLNSYDLSYGTWMNTLRDEIRSLQEREKFMTDMINKEIESMRLRFAKLQTYISQMKSLQLRIENFAKSLALSSGSSNNK